MTANSPEWTDEVIEPPRTEWPALLASSPSFPVASRLSQLRASARRRLVDAAQQYTLRLSTIGTNAGVPASTMPLLTGDPDEQKIVVTGHQPVIFHGGLTFKYHVAEQLAAAESAIGIAIVIDTVVADADRYEYPAAIDSNNDGQLCLSRQSLSVRPEKNDPIAMPLDDRSRLTGSRMDKEPFTSELFPRVIAEYSRLADAGISPDEANLIVRWSYGIGGRLMELPLSALSCFPEVLTLTSDIVNSAAQFAAVYNDRLRQYRELHDIRNRANPFPDLRAAENKIELPFWAVDSRQDSPFPLFVETDGTAKRLVANEQTLQEFTGEIPVAALESLFLKNIQLIPRGTLITSFLRLLFADLFVHGTGGGHYDRFTNELIRAWWEVEPTPFVVASASRYLFADRREELHRLETLQRDLRDLMFNPQRYVDTGRYSPELEEQLRKLIDDKTRAVEQLKTAKEEGRSAKDIGHELQTISDTMRQLVSDEFEPQLKPLTSMTEETRAAIDCRTYPWFLC